MRKKGDGGETGIRTPETGTPPTHFPGVRLRPLGHLSADLNFGRNNKVETQQGRADIHTYAAQIQPPKCPRRRTILPG